MGRRLAWVSMLGLALAFAGTAAASEAAICPVERSHYGSTADPAWSAGFKAIGKKKGWISDLAFYVRSAKTKHTYWFLFDAGSARYVNLISTFDVTKPGWHPPGADGPSSERPLGEMHYLGADKDLGFSLAIPAQSKPAPAYILLPDLPEVMWYKAATRENAPLFFKWQSCD